MEHRYFTTRRSLLDSVARRHPDILALSQHKPANRCHQSPPNRKWQLSGSTGERLPDGARSVLQHACQLQGPNGGKNGRGVEMQRVPVFLRRASQLHGVGQDTVVLHAFRAPPHSMELWKKPWSSYHDMEKKQKITEGWMWRRTRPLDVKQAAGCHLHFIARTDQRQIPRVSRCIIGAG